MFNIVVALAEPHVEGSEMPNTILEPEKENHPPLGQWQLVYHS